MPTEMRRSTQKKLAAQLIEKVCCCWPTMSVGVGVGGRRELVQHPHLLILLVTTWINRVPTMPNVAPVALPVAVDGGDLALTSFRFAPRLFILAGLQLWPAKPLRKAKAPAPEESQEVDPVIVGRRRGSPAGVLAGR